MTLASTSAHLARDPHRSRWALVAILAFLLGGVTVALLYELEVIGGSSPPTTEGSGVAATQTRNVRAFDSVELAGGNNIVIHVGRKPSVASRPTTTSSAE